MFHPHVASFDFLRYCSALALLHELRQIFYFAYHKLASGVKKGRTAYGVAYSGEPCRMVENQL